jgi:hypothetical protein
MEDRLFRITRKAVSLDKRPKDAVKCAYPPTPIPPPINDQRDNESLVGSRVVGSIEDKQAVNSGDSGNHRNQGTPYLIKHFLTTIRDHKSMARIARVIAEGYPHHITQRGNRRLQTFFIDGDYQEYFRLMAEWLTANDKGIDTRVSKA